MQKRCKYILAINCGSSSLKFGLYRSSKTEAELSGSVSNIGNGQSNFKITDAHGRTLCDDLARYNSIEDAAKQLASWIKERKNEYPLKAIGHRMVQGGPQKGDAEIVTDELVRELYHFVYLAPNHLPEEIGTVRLFHELFADVPQVICYDTAFHHNMPPEARYYALPRNYRDAGLVRYGFHGLSYESVLATLAKEKHDIKRKKIIIAHLGSGSSMVAVQNGKSVDTTMGVSPMGGLVMSTRSGDLDPGVVLFLLKRTHASVGDVDELLSKHAGLKAIAGTGDVVELLKAEHYDENAHEAIDLFCYQARKYIGSLAAAMGGIDMLVFTGGIGENSAGIRQRICHKLEFLGVNISQSANNNNEDTISSKHSRVTVRAIHTNEELMIVRHTKRIISQQLISRDYENAI